MYSPRKKITGNPIKSIGNYIEGYDVYNSKFLYLFHQLPYVDVYTITKFEYRIDLISKDMYGEDYSDLILLYNNLSVDDLRLGTKIYKFSISDVENLIVRLDDIKERLSDL